MKGKVIRKTALWTLLVLVLLVAVLFGIGYFYYGRILRNFITETVSRESRGLYTARIGSLSLNLLAGHVAADDFELVPDTALYHRKAATDTLAPLLLHVKVDRFRVRMFKVMEAVRHRRIDIRAILFEKPSITVYRMKMKEEQDHHKKKEKMMSIPLPKGLTSIGIGEVKVDRAHLVFIDCTKDSAVVNDFPECTIVIRNILVDSAHTGRHRLFNADDISVTLGKYSLTAKNGMNRFSFGEIGLSTGKSEVYISDFRLEPLYDRHEYTRKLGYQTDRIDLRIGSLKMQRVDLRRLLFEGKLHMGLLTIDSLQIDDYRDKRVPRRPGFRPAMPQDGIRNLKTYVRIDTVVLKNGRADYAEQVGDEPGTIFFDRMSATLLGLTNDSLLLHAGLVTELKGTAYMMGKGKLDATVRFNFGDPRNSFTFTALLGPTDLTTINPMLSNLLPARVVSGKVNKLFVPMVFANDDFAEGKLLFYYNDLKVEVVDTDHSTWTKIKNGVINFAANDLVVNDNNPTRSGTMKTGTVYFTRDKEKGIINFVWKSALSGLKSTMGFNSKAQKALIREEKSAIKEKRKEEKKEEKKEKKSEKHKKTRHGL